MESPGVELKHFRKNILKISQSDLSRLLKISEKTISQLESGKRKLTLSQKDILMRLAYLIGKVDGKLLFKNKKAYLEWLENPLPALNNFRPADCLETEEKFQRLLALLKELGL